MKVVILAGGLGTRLQEETVVRPKPMVEIGGRPMLWHIMNIYAAHGFREFVLALGYKGELIKKYFLDYHWMNQSITTHLRSGEVTVHPQSGNPGPLEDWTVHLVDTGANTETGGRIKRLSQWIGNETFLMTYGDGVANVDIGALLNFHRLQGKLATLTAVRLPGRFGGIDLEGANVRRFIEKPPDGEGCINGGFFVLEPKVLEYLSDDQTIFEREPLERLAAEGQLAAYRHNDFWQCMDTWRDVRRLESLWASGEAPWRPR